MPTITQLLADLVNLEAQHDVFVARKADLRRQAIPAEVQQSLDEIKVELAPQIAAIADAIAEVEAQVKAQVKAAVLEQGASAKGEHLHALYRKGRTLVGRLLTLLPPVHKIVCHGNTHGHQ
jgi:hypothetical protein